MNLQLTSEKQLLEYKKESDLPFYKANSDPFCTSERWEKMRNDPSFGATMETLGRCNKNALESGLFHWTKVDGMKHLFIDDVSLQAFLLSFSEIFGEQKRVVDTIGFISNLDLVNFAELFTGYGDGKKRTFHKNMIFNFYWFQQLMRYYENDGFQPYDTFQEFRRMGDRPQKGIANEIHRQMQIYGEVNIQFYQGDGNGTMDFFFNFNNGETRIEMKDFNRGGRLFSEYLDQNNPFQEKQKLNFLYPMGYRGFTFPMIGVTKIILKMREGLSKEYAYKSSKIPSTRDGILNNVAGIISAKNS